MPLWLLLIVLVLGSYRLTRLITKDDFPPVLWVRDRLAGGWRRPTTKEQHHESYPTGQIEKGSLTNVPGLGMFGLVEGEVQIYVRKVGWAPFWLGDLISCPWCVSAYVSLGLTLGAAFAVGLPAPLLVWPAVWGASALIASKEWA